MVSKSDIKKRFPVSKILAVLLVLELIRLCVNYDIGSVQYPLMLLMFALTIFASIYIFIKRHGIAADRNLCLVNVSVSFAIVIIEMIITNSGFIGGFVPMFCNYPKFMHCMFTVDRGMFLFPLATLSVYFCCFIYVKLYSKCYIKSIEDFQK